MRSKLTEALTPTPERLRRDESIVIPTERAGVTTVQFVTQDALDRYWRRGELAPGEPAENARRYDAGVRLRVAWQESGLEARLTGSYTPSVDGAQTGDLRMVEALAASQAYARMIRMVGIECSWPVITCCCIGEPVGKGVTMQRLRKGLALLAAALGI